MESRSKGRTWPDGAFCGNVAPSRVSHTRRTNIKPVYVFVYQRGWMDVDAPNPVPGRYGCCTIVNRD